MSKTNKPLGWLTKKMLFGWEKREERIRKNKALAQLEELRLYFASGKHEDEESKMLSFHITSDVQLHETPCHSNTNAP